MGLHIISKLDVDIAYMRCHMSRTDTVKESRTKAVRSTSYVANSQVWSMRPVNQCISVIQYNDKLYMLHSQDMMNKSQTVAVIRVSRNSS